MSAHRRCRCFGRRRDLAERLAPYVQPATAVLGLQRATVVSAEPIRRWLEGWGAATGDPFDVIARGFGLDQDLVRDLLDEEVRVLATIEDCRIRLALGMVDNRTARRRGQ